MRRAWVVTLWALAACAGPGGPGDAGRPISGFEPWLRQAGFTDAVVKPTKRFAGWVPSARRLSMIDPDGGREAWGRPFDGDVVAVEALPDFSGAAVFTRDGVTVVTESGEQSFGAGGFAGAFLTAAQEHAAYAALAEAGARLRIVRSLGGGQWQDEEKDLPWDPMAEKGANAAPAAVARWSPNGTRLLILVPETGRFAVYETDAEGRIAEPRLTCSGSPQAQAGEDLFRAILWDEERDTVYLGDRQGRVHAVDPGVCPDWDATARWDSGGAGPITGLTLLTDALVGVTQARGGATVLSYASGAFAVLATYDTCDHPAGMTAAGNGRMVTACYEVSDAYAKGEVSALPALVPYVSATLEVYGADSERLVTLPFWVDAPGLAIDAASGTLLELKDSALGVLVTTRLEDGTKTWKKGLFLDGVLD